MCGIAVPIDSLGDIFLAFSDDFCDSLFHSKCLSLCSDIILCKCMILHWNGHFEAFFHFKWNQAIQSMLLVGLDKAPFKMNVQFVRVGLLPLPQYIPPP